MQTSVVTRIVFGHPEFWKAVHGAYPRFFEVHPRLKDSFNSVAAKPRTFRDRDQKIILNLSLLAGVAMEELVTLVGNGLGIGAMKIARNLLELSINAEYLRMNPAAVDDFVDWFWVEQHKWLAYAQQHDPDLLKTFTPEATEHTRQEFARVRPRFENPNTGKLRPGWCAVDLASRAVETHLELPYRLINPFGSQFLHGTSGAVLNHFDLAKSQEQIAAPPSLKWCPQALCGGHHCVAMAIHTLETMFQEEASPSADEIAKDFQYAWDPSEAGSPIAEQD
jgi:hypothetical protein